MKSKGGPLATKKFSKKSRTVLKKLKGGTLQTRPVLYVTRLTSKNTDGGTLCNNLDAFSMYSFS